MRLIYEYRKKGGSMNWIAMTGSEFLSFDGHISQLMQYRPQAIYHHGSVTDDLFKRGEYDEIRRRLEVIRKKTVPVGLGTHRP